jgi:hypothetical protein
VENWTKEKKACHAAKKVFLLKMNFQLLTIAIVITWPPLQEDYSHITGQALKPV